MKQYLARLRVAGIKPYDARLIYDSFMRTYGLKELNDFVETLENERNVETVQSEPDRA